MAYIYNFLVIIAWTIAPKLGERCLLLAENKTLECGENQFCNENFGICFCMNGYIAFNGRCMVNEWISPASTSEMTSTASTTTVTEMPIIYIDHSTEVIKADSKGTFKAVVIFLLVLAILLCIALGIVIIWRYLNEIAW